MKKILALPFFCFIFLTSFGQDSTLLFSNSVFKIHLSTGGEFLKNVETEFLEARMPFSFVEAGLEIGTKFNFENSIRRTFGSADTSNLNFTKLHFGFNNKSQLNKNLSLVLRLGVGFIFENKDYRINREITDNRVRFLRVGGSIEQRLFKDATMVLNIGYDVSKNALFSGLGVAMGVKVGIPSR